MHSYHCLIINDVSGFICWQNSTTGFRIGWDNADYGMFGCFSLSITLASRHFYLTLI